MARKWISSDGQFRAANVLHPEQAGSGGALLAGVFRDVRRPVMAGDTDANLEWLHCICDCCCCVDHRRSISGARTSGKRRELPLVYGRRAGVLVGALEVLAMGAGDRAGVPTDESNVLLAFGGNPFFGRA